MRSIIYIPIFHLYLMMDQVEDWKLFSSKATRCTKPLLDKERI